ncbi:SPOR domain-containing protein [Microvirga mediterraneensis]|uniref:SPOR domain-containing protein n=1 Tax=Microvirga mediterraneensis TaxID=2754695 RepID=A0A838BP86_9HYPH|nr:SPOR domain-containing protein [Microvirga mediterraneensis]MBA1156763.1 SPOR domain-containing protein [Microvirga mediterraneensis]
MSESVKPRFAVDLNEIERQLAQAGTPQSQPASAGRNDPLAELARIVGQDDPFQALLANDGSARPRQQGSSIDDLFAVRDTMPQPAREVPVRAPQGGHAAPSFDLGGYPQSHVRAPEPAYPRQPAHQNQDAYGNEAYAQDYYADQAGPYADQDYDQPQDYAPIEKGRSRKGVIAMAAVVGAVVLGGGGAYMASGSSAITGGEPPLVKANNEPTKVQPQNPGGVEIPNQNKQIYERANQNAATKVVNREEQPVDLQQAVRMNGGAVADATGGTIPTSSVKPHQTASLNLGEPKKVRTVTIRPDGTVAGSERPAAQPAAPAAMTLPPQAQAAPVQTASAQPRAAASTPVAAPATPAPTPKPAAATPAPTQVASVQPVAPAAAAAETTPSGGFAVQLGLANSEAGAQTAFASFQRRYPDLEGMPSLIRKAEVNGNTIYRVRVGPLSKDEASSLCSKLQGQGGQCFVAKN